MCITKCINIFLDRDIQDKYRLTLTEQARLQVAQGASIDRVSHTMFIRVQYDVLRRLRAYWLPRFLLHLHSDVNPSITKGCNFIWRIYSNNRGENMKIDCNKLHLKRLIYYSRPDIESRPMIEPITKEEKRSVAMFPSICLANSMPVRPDDLLQIAETANWDMVFKGGRRLDDRVKSGRAVNQNSIEIQ